MTDQNYHVKPGDLVSAELWNNTIDGIEADIQEQISTAIENLESVPNSGDAAKFGGKTPAEYAEEIVQRVLHELPKRTGYMVLFKELKLNEESIVEHKLGACPLTDIYQLDYFHVVASEDDHIFEAFTTFYLYHAGESKIRFRPEESPTAPAIAVEIDPSDGYAYRIPFETMLNLYNVDYTDDSSLGDVENDFWQAFYSAPNDEFDDDQYYHSPWFDRCCREGRTVKYLRGRREWDDIYFQVRPRKTVNYPTDPVTQTGGITIAPSPTRSPSNIEVVHFNLNTLGLKLLANAELPPAQTNPTASSTVAGWPVMEGVSPAHIKVMALLKV
jgi:hypothetical protein